MSTASAALPTDRQQIDAFLDALWLEKNLGENTLAAYRQDLLQVAVALAAQGLSLDTADEGALTRLLGQKLQSGAALRSVARLLSSIRRFYGHYQRVNPCQWASRQGSGALRSAPQGPETRWATLCHTTFCHLQPPLRAGIGSGGIQCTLPTPWRRYWFRGCPFTISGQRAEIRPIFLALPSGKAKSSRCGAEQYFPRLPQTAVR